MALQLFSSRVLAICASAVCIQGLAIPGDSSPLSKRDDGYVKLPVTMNLPDLYYVTLEIGSNRQPVTLELDTGSSDLWVPSANTTAGGFNSSESSTFKDTEVPFDISYESPPGEYLGTYVTDTVSFPNGPSVENVTFADVTTVPMGGVSNGILGVGFTGNEEAGAARPYPNFPISLKTNGLIKKNAYSFYMDGLYETTGSLLFGAVDTEKYLGDLVKLPDSQPNHALAVNVTGVTAPNGNVTTGSFSALLDSGSTDIMLPAEFVAGLAASLGQPENVENGFGVDCDTPLPGNLEFSFDGVTIAVPVQSLVTKIEIAYGYHCFIAVRTSDLDDGVNVLGQYFLRNAYVLYDLDDNAILLAQAKFTSASNIVVLE